MRIPINLAAVEESKPVPAGAKYNLVVTEAEEAKSKAGNSQISVSIAIEGHDNAPNLRHFISLPQPGDEPGKANYKALLLKRFLVLFQIPFNGAEFDTNDFAGAKAYAELGLDESGDFNRLVLPRMRGEAQQIAAVRPPKGA
jgi:hypothetical protein